MPWKFCNRNYGKTSAYFHYPNVILNPTRLSKLLLKIKMFLSILTSKALNSPKLIDTHEYVCVCMYSRWYLQSECLHMTFAFNRLPPDLSSILHGAPAKYRILLKRLSKCWAFQLSDTDTLSKTKANTFILYIKITHT